MAKVVLKQVKKVYPYSKNEMKKYRKNRGAKENSNNGSNLHLSDEGIVAVQDFNLEVNDKEFVVLVGPSGCGKSTTLRMIAGLEEISEGELWIGDKLMNDVAPKDRDIAMVFQNYALYPHMTVYDNMAFALKLKRLPKAVIDNKVHEAAEILNITEYLNRKPKTLSGGQRQRVAIGRAIVRNPQVFLMDEPLSNLDAKLRNQMRAEIIKLHNRINTTFIYVTHDQTEAMTLGDRIVIMLDGVIQQIGTPQQVFNYPANLFVAGFIGSPQMNFFDVKIEKKGGQYKTILNGISIPLTAKMNTMLLRNDIKDQEAVLGIRPEHMSIATHDDANAIPANVDVVEMMGSETHIHLNLDGKDVVLRVPTMNLEDKYEDNINKLTKVRFKFSAAQIHLFSAEDGNNLLLKKSGNYNGEPI